jgi:hypothetical protein
MGICASASIVMATSFVVATPILVAGSGTDKAGCARKWGAAFIVGFACSGAAQAALGTAVDLPAAFIVGFACSGARCPLRPHPPPGVTVHQYMD